MSPQGEWEHPAEQGAIDGGRAMGRDLRAGDGGRGALSMDAAQRPPLLFSVLRVAAPPENLFVAGVL